MVAGYTLVRSLQALADLREPGIALDKDAAAYGALRRGLMLSGLVRSLAGLAVAAYVVGPRIDAAETPEPRLRRVALVASGLALSALADLPVDYVEDAVLERRYGLSKQGSREWSVERGKSFALSLAIGVPLSEALATAIERAPRNWPLVATAGAVPLLVLANVVAPTFIAPLFNKFEPIEGEFANQVRSLAERFGAGDATLLRMNMSKQTEKANAYVTGLFGTKRIVIGDTLLDRFERRETLFVVAHELGHYVRGDVWRSVAVGTAASALMSFGSRRLAEGGGRSAAGAAGLARLFFTASLLGTFVTPLLAAFSRSRERAADRFACEATGDAASGAAAFHRLRERNLAEEQQPLWMELLFSSHPSLRSRIERLEARAAQAPSTAADDALEFSDVV